MNINRRADRGRKGKSQRSGKPFGLCAPLRIPLSGIPFSPSLLQAKDDLSRNARKSLDTTSLDLGIAEVRIVMNVEPRGVEESGYFRVGH